MRDEQPDAIDNLEREDRPRTDSENRPGPGSTPSRAPRRVLFVSLIMASSALLTTVVTLFHAHTRYTADDARNGHILAAASRLVTDLTTLSGGDVAAQANSVAAQTVGTFRDEFSSERQNFVSVVQQGHVTSVGEVRAVGLIRADNATAQVLAAVSAHVSNSQSPAGQPRQYRMRVTLALVDSHWLISNVELVP